MTDRVDIIVRRAKKIACENRLRGRQVIAREVARGPVTLRVPLLVYRASEQQHRQIERAWLIVCRTPTAVSYVRHRIRELMKDLDGSVIEDGPRSE